MLTLSEKYMDAIGFDDLPQETAMEKMSRNQMIDFTCRMKSEKCLNLMHSKLISHIEKIVKLPVNLESSAFCYGLMASAMSGEGSQLIEALWKEMQASGNTEYRLRIINSLGCYGDVKVLSDLLETILASTAEVRYLTAENFAIIQSVYTATTEGLEATIDFFTEFGNDAIRRSQVKNLVEVLLENLPTRIFNQRLFDKVKFRKVFRPEDVPIIFFFILYSPYHFCSSKECLKY